MPIPEIGNFGDEDHEQGESGLVIDGAGYGAFPGEVWMYQNSDRTGNADQLTQIGWNDLQITGVAIPASTNNAVGAVFLFVQHENLGWSLGLSFTLSVAAGASDRSHPAAGWRWSWS